MKHLRPLAIGVSIVLFVTVVVTTMLGATRQGPASMPGMNMGGNPQTQTYLDKLLTRIPGMNMGGNSDMNMGGN